MNRHTLFIICLLICWLITQGAPRLTRSYTSRYYTTRDGLVQMQVMSIYQDKNGFMWFGTKYGVSRFDGENFKNYTVKEGLPLGEIKQFCDWGDKVVMATRTHLIILYPNDSIVYYKFPTSEVLFGINPVLQVKDEDNLFILNALDISYNDEYVKKVNNYIFNIKEKKFIPLNFTQEFIHHFDSEYAIFGGKIYQIAENFHLIPVCDIPFDFSRLIADFEKKVIFFIDFEKTNNLRQLIAKKYRIENNQLLFDEEILIDFPTSYHEIIILPDTSLLHFDSRWKAKFHPPRNIDFGLNLLIVNDMYVDREDNIWIASDCGLYNFFNLNIEEYKFNLSQPDNIWSVVEDTDSNLWIGSYGAGLWKMDKRNNFEPMFSKVQDWNLQYMGSIRTKAGILYFPNGNGVLEVNNNISTFYGNTNPAIGSYYDEVRKKIYYSGTLNKDDLKYFGVYAGIGDNKKFFEVRKGLPRSIIKDSNGRIVLGSPDGLSYLINDSILVEDTIARPYQSVISMDMDKKGRIWKGTDKGLFVELTNGREIMIGENKVAAPVYSVKVYHDKYVLAGGIRAFYIVDLNEKNLLTKPEIWEIGYDAGFTGLESGQNGFYEDYRGDVWLTTALSVLKFNPEKLVQSQKRIIPQVKLSEISFSPDNHEWKNIYLNSGHKEIQIDRKNKYLRFEYFANSISAPKSLRFRYRLRGFSDEWSQEIYNKNVEFNNPGYGKFRFEIQSSLDGENWSDIEVSPEIIIKKPFYLSIFAFILYFLLVAGISTIVTIKISRKRQAKKIKFINLQKLENELQLSTLRSKVIPHFTKNVLSAIGNFAMTNRVKASYYISVFSKFTQLTLTNADKNYISISEELEYLNAYLELEKMRFKKRFNYNINVQEKIPLNMQIPGMILHTYCDNAIRHGLVNKEGEGWIEVNISRTGNGILFTVSDNGIGRKRAEELGTKGNGQGLKLLESQINLYNQFNKTLTFRRRNS